MSILGETTSTSGAITSEAATPKVMSMETIDAIAMAPRSPRQKLTLMREVPR